MLLEKRDSSVLPEYESEKWRQNIRGGEAALRSGNFKQAAKQFQSALRRAELDENLWGIMESLLAIGGVRLSTEDLSEDTLSVMTRTLQVGQQLFQHDDYRLAEAHHNLAAYYVVTNVLDKAEEQLKIVCELSKSAPVESRPGVLYLFAELCGDLNKPADAIAAYKEAIELEREVDPEGPFLSLLLNSYQAYLQILDKSTGAFERVKQMDTTQS